MPSTSKLLVTCLFALFALPWVPAHASAPQLLSHQALLTDDLGVPLEGPVALSFRLYNAPSFGALLWVESHPAVPLSTGVASVTLGGITPFAADLFEVPGLWLEIEVEGEILDPRQRLVSVPFALESEKAADLSLACDEGDFLRYSGGSWGCSCLPGTSRACYTGPSGTEGTGQCSGGSQICASPGYGACTGDTTPVSEICGNLLDDDCDGAADDGCPVVCVQLDNPAPECGPGVHCTPDLAGSGTCGPLTGAGGQGVACADTSDCNAGFVCLAANGDDQCLAFCEPIGSSCTGGNTCLDAFLPPIQGVAWGVCL